ncbi:MAG: DNA polymerase III subunit beta [Candidatus Pacebacteria bacterium]|nr:DNA polymerase III subunit beta [Candidatus Paceibacterota bacterium]
MKIECEKKDLLNALSVTEKIAGTNPTLPVLGCVLLVVKENTLTVRSTNLELGVESVLPVNSEEDGVIAVPSAVFYNTIQNTFDSKITLQTKGDTVVISTKHSTTTLNTQPNEDFPSLPVIDSSVGCTIKTDELIRGIQSVVYSASHSTIKPELSSVYIYENDKKINFVATDSFRLAEKVIQIKQKNSLSQSFLLPLRNAVEIVRILNQIGDTDVVLKITDNQISFEVDNIYITSRVIDGVFPDYKQIIPKDYVTEVVVLKQDLLNTFKKINIFSDRFGQVSIAVEPKKKLFTVSAHNSSVGETNDSIDAVIKGESIDMRFNYRYIYDCLSSIHSDSITLLFTGIGKPLIIKGVSDESFLYLVMPMNK